MAVASPAGEDCSLRDSWRIAASWASSFGCRGACGEDSMGCDCSVASWPVGPCVTEADSSGRHGPSSGCSLIAIVRLTGPEDRSTCRASRAFFPRVLGRSLLAGRGSEVIVKTITSGNARFLPLVNVGADVPVRVNFFTERAAPNKASPRPPPHPRNRPGPCSHRPSQSDAGRDQTRGSSCASSCRR